MCRLTLSRASSSAGNGDRLPDKRRPQGEVDPARTASEFDVGYYRELLENAWGEVSFVFSTVSIHDSKMRNIAKIN